MVKHSRRNRLKQDRTLWQRNVRNGGLLLVFLGAVLVTNKQTSNSRLLLDTTTMGVSAPHFTRKMTTEFSIEITGKTDPQDPREDVQNTAASTTKQSLVLDCHSVAKNASPPTNTASLKAHFITAPKFEMVLHDNTEEAISRRIAAQGCYECHILYPLLAALKHHQPTEVSLIDIGGNMGMYSLFAASLGYHTVAFEPFSTNQQKFCQSLTHPQNIDVHLLERVQLVGAALVATEEEAYVNFNTNGFTQAVDSRVSGMTNMGSLVVSGTTVKPAGIEGKDYAQGITLTSMSSILPKPGSKVVLKVDVEGSECKALVGGLTYLSQLDIQYVAMEWSKDRLGDCEANGHLEAILDLFGGAKYGLRPYMNFRGQWTEVDAKNWQSWPGVRANLFDFAWSKNGPPRTYVPPTVPV